MHIIFVENIDKKPDKYFNYAYKVNKGVKIALKYNPKWVIISNDEAVEDLCISLRIDKISGF